MKSRSYHRLFIHLIHNSFKAFSCRETAFSTPFGKNYYIPGTPNRKLGLPITHEFMSQLCHKIHCI